MPVEFCHSVIQWDWVWEINYKSLDIIFFYTVNLPPSLNMDVDVAIISPNAIFM